MINNDPNAKGKAYVVVASYDDDEEIYTQVIEVHMSKQKAERAAQEYTDGFDAMQKYHHSLLDFEYAYKKKHTLQEMKPRRGPVTAEQKLEILKEKEIYKRWRDNFDEAIADFNIHHNPIAKLNIYGYALYFIGSNYNKGCWEGGFGVEEVEYFE